MKSVGGGTAPCCRSRFPTWAMTMGVHALLQQRLRHGALAARDEGSRSTRVRSASEAAASHLDSCSCVLENR